MLNAALLALFTLAAPKTVAVEPQDLFPHVAQELARARVDRDAASRQYYAAKAVGNRRGMDHWRRAYRRAYDAAARAERVLAGVPTTRFVIHPGAHVTRPLWERMLDGLRRGAANRGGTWHVYSEGRDTVVRRRGPRAADRPHPWRGKSGAAIRKMLTGRRHLGRLEAVVGTLLDTEYVFVDADGRRWIIGAGARALRPFDWASWKRDHVRARGNDTRDPRSPYRRVEVWHPQGKNATITISWLR